MSDTELDGLDVFTGTALSIVTGNTGGLLGGSQFDTIGFQLPASLTAVPVTANSGDLLLSATGDVFAHYTSDQQPGGLDFRIYFVDTGTPPTRALIETVARALTYTRSASPPGTEPPEVTLRYTFLDEFAVNASSIARDLTIVRDAAPALFTSGNDTVDLNDFDLSLFTLAEASDALAGDDTVTLSGTQNIGSPFTGNAGNDFITGSGGAEFHHGFTGDDKLRGGAGDDVLHGGDHGAEGDMAILSDATGVLAFTLDASGGAVATAAGSGTDTLSAIENLVLGSGNDTVSGNDTANLIYGGLGDDVLAGGGGNDAILGGDGDDAISGDGGADFMFGGIGNDRFVVDTYAGEAVVEFAGEGIDVVYAMIDYAVGLNIEQIIMVEGSAAVNAGGGEDDNVIIGNSAANLIYGYGGNDSL